MSQHTMQQQIDAVAREIKMRESVYPRWVAAKKMSQDKATHEIAAMKSVLATLIGLQAAEPIMMPAAPDRKPLERSKLMLDAKVVIEHYDRVIDRIDPATLAKDADEADFVMTVTDYKALRDFACRAP